MSPFLSLHCTDSLGVVPEACLGPAAEVAGSGFPSDTGGGIRCALRDAFFWNVEGVGDNGLQISQGTADPQPGLLFLLGFGSLLRL